MLHANFPDGQTECPLLRAVHFLAPRASTFVLMFTLSVFPGYPLILLESGLHPDWLDVFILREVDWQFMPHYDVLNLPTINKTNVIDSIPFGYGTLRTTAVRIQHLVSSRTAQRSQLLSKFPANLRWYLSYPIIWLSCKSNIGSLKNALAESKRTVLSLMEAWEHPEVVRRTAKVAQSIWVVCSWLPNWFTFCSRLSSTNILLWILTL